MNGNRGCEHSLSFLFSAILFGSQKTEITATHMLLVTPVNEYMYDSEWVNNVYNYSQTELTDSIVGDDWKGAYFQHHKPLPVYLRD